MNDNIWISVITIFIGITCLINRRKLAKGYSPSKWDSLFSEFYRSESRRIVVITFVSISAIVFGIIVFAFTILERTI